MKVFIVNKKIIIAVWILFVVNCIAQDFPDFPVALESDDLYTQMKSATIGTTLPIRDNTALQAKAELYQDDDEIIYGEKEIYNYDLINSIQPITLSDGRKVLTKSFNSSNAYGLQVFFTTFNIPEGAKLFIYNEDLSHISRSFTKYNSPLPSDMSYMNMFTEPIKGNTIIIEYQEPPNPEFSGEVVIGSVAHIFNSSTFKSDFSSNNRNVKCMECDTDDNGTIDKDGFSETNGYLLARRSVVLLRYYNSNYDHDDWNSKVSYHVGSGVLLNSQDYKGEPNILTAKHVLFDPESQAKRDTEYQLTIELNDEAKTCRDYTAEENALGKFVGAKIVACSGSKYELNFNYDYALLKIKDTKKNELGQEKVCWAGWNIDDSKPIDGVCIHHPGQFLKYYTYFNQIDEGTMSYDFSQGDGNPGLTLQLGGEVWAVNKYSIPGEAFGYLGDIARGSSGSPLFNRNAEVVGICIFDAESPLDQDGFLKLSTIFNDNPTIAKLLNTSSGIKHCAHMYQDPLMSSGSNKFYQTSVVGDCKVSKDPFVLKSAELEDNTESDDRHPCDYYNNPYDGPLVINGIFDQVVPVSKDKPILFSACP